MNAELFSDSPADKVAFASFSLKPGRARDARTLRASRPQQAITTVSHDRSHSRERTDPAIGMATPRWPRPRLWRRDRFAYERGRPQLSSVEITANRSRSKPAPSSWRTIMPTRSRVARRPEDEERSLPRRAALAASKRRQKGIRSSHAPPDIDRSRQRRQPADGPPKCEGSPSISVWRRALSCCLRNTSEQIGTRHRCGWQITFNRSNGRTILGMTAAIFGLLGVIVGALTTGYVQYRLQRRAEARAARTASRLMRVETSELLGFVIRSLSEERWAGNPSEELATHAWKEHRDVFAAAADRHRWDAVSLAFTTASELQRKADKVAAWDRIEPDSPQENDLLELRGFLAASLHELEMFGEFEHSLHPLRTRVGRRRAKRRLAQLGIPPDDG